MTPDKPTPAPTADARPLHELTGWRRARRSFELALDRVPLTALDRHLLTSAADAYAIERAKGEDD